MSLSVKWTAVSFFTLTALGAASFAFAGCTVTSGGIDNTEGGTVKPDAGGDGATGDSAVANACPGNTKQLRPILTTTCQNKLNAVCCNELKTCFDIVLTADPKGERGTDDCNALQKCLGETCKLPDGGVDSKCQDDCVTASQDSVVNAYDAISECATKNANDVCQ